MDEVALLCTLHRRDTHKLELIMGWSQNAQVDETRRRISRTEG
jgi:hypothetical protein